MEEADFRRLLNLFPIVRSKNYYPDNSKSIRGSTSRSAQNEIAEWNIAWDEMDLNKDGTDYEDRFWQKLISAAEKQATKEEAERFCKAFQRIYRKLVCEELSLDAAGKFVDAAPSLTG